MQFGVKGWSPKIDVDIFEEPGNQRVILDLKIHKKMIFSQSRLDMAMHGCNLVLRVGSQKSIWTFLKSSKIREYFLTLK